MKRRNVLTWNEFYENNIFCKHISIDNCDIINKKSVCIYQDKKKIFKWMCQECLNQNNKNLKCNDNEQNLTKITK